MKKRLIASLVVAALALTACSTGKSGTNGGNSNFKTDSLTVSEDFDLQKLDYTVTDKNSDHEFVFNLVDTLLENDRLGNLIPSLATEWKANDDKTVWTFKLRDGVKWYTNTGEEYPKALTSEDFVTGLRHGADFKSNMSWLLEGLIKGYKEYCASKKTDEDWAKVGIKTPDEKTVVYELTRTVPYFETMVTYGVFSPVKKEFLESKGEGCKLGAPDPKKCDFGKATPDSILYNGCFLLSKYQAKSEAELVQNANYWDKKNVHLKSVKYIYSDGSDMYSGIKNFEAGTTATASLVAAWKDYDVYLEKYKKYAFLSMPNASAFGVIFNMNRKSFKQTKYANDETLRKNTREAVLNENFRKALRSAFDAVAWLGSNAPEVVAKAQIRNINNFPDAGTTKEGTYFELVEKAFTELNGKRVNLKDGQYPWLNKEEAMKYIEKAKAEGVKFPVHLDLPVAETRKDLVNKANSIAQSVKENTDGNILVEPVLMDRETLTNVAFQLSDPAKADYDISTFSGWGPDYADPKSFCDIFNGVDGTYLKNMGLQPGDKDKEIKDKIGMSEYTKMVQEADKITKDMDARYKSYAKCDAFLLQKAFFLPNSQQTRGLAISRVKPFTRYYAPYGKNVNCWKGLELQNKMVTAEEFAKAQDAWEKARAASKK